MNLNKHYNFHVIAGFGNPLMDISVVLEDKILLEKYNLNPDGQKEVNVEELKDILSSIDRAGYEVTRSPGGCAQNTLRTVQKLVGHPSFCVLFGGLGTDEEGCVLESQLINAGVETRYAKHSSLKTGQAVALINGVSRSLIAHLGAAEIYRLEDFNSPETLQVMQEVYIAYIEGFFITHSVEVALEAIRLCHNHGVVVVFNICGVYVADICPEALSTVACAADIVIGNKEEFISLANILKIKRNVFDEMAVNLHCVLWKDNYRGTFKLNQMGGFGKTLIITQGSDPVLCVCGDRSLVKYNVPYLDPKRIKDPTGAGDTFAAGFLVALLQDKPLIGCLALGCSVAQEVIQNIGVDLCSWELK